MYDSEKDKVMGAETGRNSSGGVRGMVVGRSGCFGDDDTILKGLCCSHNCMYLLKFID